MYLRVNWKFRWILNEEAQEIAEEILAAAKAAKQWAKNANAKAVRQVAKALQAQRSIFCKFRTIFLRRAAPAYPGRLFHNSGVIGIGDD